MSMKQLFFKFYALILRKNSFIRRNFFGLVLKLGRAKFVCQGCNFLLNPVSTIESRLIAEKIHDQKVGKAIDETLEQNAVFLDIGANIGYFTILAAKKGATVLAFEPSLRELKCLYQNLSINPELISNVFVYPHGLSDKEEILEFYLNSEQNPGKNSLICREEAVSKHTIKVFAGDDVIPSRYWSQIRLIKIDIEGAEFFALKGIQKILKSAEKLIVIVEITSELFIKLGYSVDELYDFMEDCGFTHKQGRNKDLGVQYDELFIKTKNTLKA